MIICRSKGFIFIRVPKTASSSISKHLCSKITFGQNDAYSEFAGYPALNVHTVNDRKHEHATLSQFLESKIITQEDIDTLNVYGVLRNPVDRTISMFSHVLKNFEKKDISTYTKNDVIDLGLKIFHNSPMKYFYSETIKSTEKFIKVYAFLPQTFWLVHNCKPISNVLIYPNFSPFLEMYTGTSKLDFNLKVTRKYSESQRINSSYIVELKKLFFSDFEMWEKYTNSYAVTY